MEYNKEEIEKIVNENVENIENWTIEQIEEPIFIDQIEEGQVEEENFYEAVTGMGLPYIKKGRIPFAEVEEIAPELLQFFKESINPRSDTKDVLKMKTQKGVKKINDRISKTNKIKQRNKTQKIDRNKKIHLELKNLESKNVSINRNLMWSLYYIMRGKKRAERFEEEGKDLELLKLQNSFLTDETLEELKELRSEFYEE